MEQSNSGLVQQAFLNAQRGIEEYRAKIEEKNREINELNSQIENVGR
jgi:cell division protein FtsL